MSHAKRGLFSLSYIFFAIHRMPFCLDDLKVFLGESSPHPPGISPFTATISQNVEHRGRERWLGDDKEHSLLPGTGVHSQHPYPAAPGDPNVLF